MRPLRPGTSFGAIVLVAATFGLVVDAARSLPDDATAATGIAGETTVDVSGFAFPANVEVDVGATVRWHNAGAAAHTVTAEDGGFAEPLAAGAEVAHTFDLAGTYPYFCEIHPAMRGTVIVSTAGPTTTNDREGY